MITVGEAKHFAKDWIEAEAPNIPHFRGAFLIGSILWKEDDTLHPEISDVDVKILVDIDDPKQMIEQNLIQHYQSYQGITLEIIFTPFKYYNNPEEILANFGHAAHFSVYNILSDPTGELSAIQKVVAAQYAQKKWVMKRIEAARAYTLNSLDYLDTGTIGDRWLELAFGLICGLVQIPIQAKLQPPTVRKASIIFQKIMKNQGRQDIFDAILKIFGIQAMDRADVERYFEDLSNSFDYAVEIIRSPSMADLISPLARPVVIDGSRELIDEGFHREALIWIITMRAICQEIILQDAPEEEQQKYGAKYEDIMAELGFHSADDFQEREGDIKRLLEEVMQVADQIVETNPKIIQ